MKKSIMNKPAYYPFFSDEEEYNRFIAGMKTIAIEGNLPFVFEDDDPMDLDLDSIRRFSIKFREDTGLDAGFHFYTCENCNKLHCLLTVDYLDDEEEE